MTMTNTLDEYSNELRNAGDVILGNVCWYSVTDVVRMEHSKLEAMLAAHGLERFTPKPPRDDDVFRRVCSAAALKRIPTGQPDVWDNYLVRDVRRTAGRVFKHIVVESVDRSDRKLGYHPVIELMFNSEDSSIKIDMLPGFDRGISGFFDHKADEMAKAIISQFYMEQGNLNSYAIRELIRRVLLASNATIVREGGGVYFVLQQHAMNVSSLEIIASQIDGVNVHSIPLPDSQKQRKMLRAAFEAETVGEIDRTLAEIDEMMRGPEITERKYTEMIRNMNRLRSKTKEYEDLLEEEVDNTSFRLQVYEKRMRDLLNHVKV